MQQPGSKLGPYEHDDTSGEAVDDMAAMMKMIQFENLQVSYTLRRWCGPIDG